MELYLLSAITTLLAAILTFYLSFRIGMERVKYKVEPWETSNKLPVLIANRVHLHTVESMVVFLPIFWIATIYGSARYAGIIGFVWLSARIWYAINYTKNPKMRQAPFMLHMACLAILTLIGFYGIFF